MFYKIFYLKNSFTKKYMAGSLIFVFSIFGIILTSLYLNSNSILPKIHIIEKQINLKKNTEYISPVIQHENTQPQVIKTQIDSSNQNSEEKKNKDIILEHIRDTDAQTSIQNATPINDNKNTDKSIIFVVQKNETIFSLLKKAKLKKNEFSAIMNLIASKKYAIKPLMIKDQVLIRKSADGNLELLAFGSVPLIKINVIKRDSTGHFFFTTLQNSLNKEVLKVSDRIESSLFSTASKLGMSKSTVMKLVDIYKGDLNFKKNLPRSSNLEVLFEKYYDTNGNPVKDGEILYAAINTKTLDIAKYRYKTPSSKAVYVDKTGSVSFGSVFIMPIQFGGYRISSIYGKRKHPIYNVYKWHKGLDLAAPLKTPVVATADGVIEFKGKLGGYGNYLKIKHNDFYSTAYAHLASFESSIEKGTFVRSGQIIGFVGKTGIVTGPHLHYEIIYKGKQVDPLKLKTKFTLSPRESESFSKEIYRIEALREKTPYFILNDVNIGKNSSPHIKDFIDASFVD